MRNRFNKLVFVFLVFSFVISLLKTTGSACELNEEEFEMEISKMGSEECGEDLTYTLDLISHDIENLNFEEKNASHVNRMLSSNYAEPNLENLSYPPEQTL